MSNLDATVFVVDDEPAMRSSFAALITSLNFKCQTFSSGEELLRAATPEQPGCAIVDYRLGGIDGLELNRRLVQSGCRLPVILISGYLDVRTVARALDQGIFRVVEKPYDDDEIVSAVRDAVDHDAACRRKRLLRLDFEHRLESLDARERLTLECILAGQSNKAIEHRLRLSRRTIERIRSSILDKMNSLSFVELSATVGEARAVGAFRPHIAVAPLPRRAQPAAASLAREQTAVAVDVQPRLPLQQPQDVAEGRAAQQISAALECLRAVEDGHSLPTEARSPLREAHALLSMALEDLGC